jgi:hypothetical protein
MVKLIRMIDKKEEESKKVIRFRLKHIYLSFPYEGKNMKVKKFVEKTIRTMELDGVKVDWLNEDSVNAWFKAFLIVWRSLFDTSIMSDVDKSQLENLYKGGLYDI